MKYGLKENIVEQIKSVFEKFPQVEKAVIYGSRAKGNFKNGSDIDLVLYGNKLTLQIINKISNEIDDLLLPYKFDISIYHQISNKDLLEHIGRVGVVFYEPENIIKTGGKL